MDNRVYSKMFNWLFIGLLITFLSAYSLSLNPTLLINILQIGVIPIFITELVIAFVMGFFIKKLSPLMTKVFYLLYSIITGITFGSIFIAYDMTSIITIFLVTALLCGLLGFYGYTTKKDITKWGTILFVALLAVLIISLLNIFIFKSTGLEFWLSNIIVLIFLIYVAYDIHNVKYLVNMIDEDKAAVYGAFQIYLDFINVFIRLLELYGKRDD